MTRSREQSGLKPGELDTDAVVVRTLAESDLDAIVRIDASASGRERRDYFKDRVHSALRDSRIHPSLVAELDGIVVGFLMATMYYGQFGRPEPTAVVDAVGVHSDFRGRKVAKAMMRQFLLNADRLGVERVRTEVNWNDIDLVRFFDASGFRHSGRIVLERDLQDR